MTSDPKVLEQHKKEGTLHILFLAIDSKGQGNLVESSSNPEQIYKKMIDGFTKEGLELRGKISAAKSLNAAEIRNRLQSPPYSTYFTQGGNLPAVDLQNLSDSQTGVLYEICLLEEQVRSAHIVYGGSDFSTTLIPENMNVKRQGDCNAVANYYASLASFCGSETLQKAVGLVSVEDHAQLCFDLGGANGKPLKFSKNTSYVDMAQVDASGQQTNKNIQPYAHNFYDFSADEKKYGLNPSMNVHSIDRFVASELGEINDIHDFKKADNAALQNDLSMQEQILAMHPHNPAICSNAIQNVWEQKSRGMMTDEMAKTKITAILMPYIDASYLSVIQIANVYNTFGQEAAQPLMQKYEQRILSDSGNSFRNFILASKNNGDNPNSVNSLNAAATLNYVKQMAKNSNIQDICIALEKNLKVI